MKSNRRVPRDPTADQAIQNLIRQGETPAGRLRRAYAALSPAGGMLSQTAEGPRDADPKGLHHLIAFHGGSSGCNHDSRS
jgi:hypothetical protein